MINIYCIRPKGFNIGNDAIFVALNHFLRSSFKESYNIISLPATSKYESHSKAGITSKTVYEINQFGHGLIIGGGNLYENGELEVNETALNALEVPLMIFSVSRGKIFNKNGILVNRSDVMTDKNISLLNNRADISLSRDKATYEYIKGLGCENTLGYCPTLFMNETPQHLIPVSFDQKTDLLISVRTPDLMSIPLFNRMNVKNEISEMISYAKEKGYKNIKLLCHDHRDIPFAASFQEVDYLYTEDIYEYLTWLKNTKLNITYRLHSFIPCVAFGVPSIKISYDQRAMSLVESIGLGDWNINQMEGNVLSQVKERISNLSSLEDLVSKNKDTLWKTIHNTISENFDEFYKMVKAY